MKRTTDDALNAALPQKVPQPTLRALAEAGISTLGQLAALSEKELLKCTASGRRAFASSVRR